MVVFLGLAGVFGVAVHLLFTLTGCTACCFAPADDAAVAVADACAEAAEDFGVLVAPFPDTVGKGRRLEGLSDGLLWEEGGSWRTPCTGSRRRE